MIHPLYFISPSMIYSLICLIIVIKIQIRNGTFSRYTKYILTNIIYMLLATSRFKVLFE